MKPLNRIVAMLMLSGAVTCLSSTISPATASADTNLFGLCHGTGSPTQPYVFILVDRDALAGHFDGLAPGHGSNNYPDIFLGEFPSGYQPGGRECMAS